MITVRYFIFIAGNLISWRSKKQIIVAGSNGKAERVSCNGNNMGIMWLKQLLQLADMERMKLICDNQATVHISPIPIFMKK